MKKEILGYLSRIDNIIYIKKIGILYLYEDTG